MAQWTCKDLRPQPMASRWRGTRDKVALSANLVVIVAIELVVVVGVLFPCFVLSLRFVRVAPFRFLWQDYEHTKPLAYVA